MLHSPLNPILNKKDIKAAVDSGSFSRGQDYFKRGYVESIEVNTDPDNEQVVIYSKVKGSGREHYQTEIVITDYFDHINIEGSCSCPVGYNCKHVAATCLAYLQAQEPDNHKPTKPTTSQNSQTLNPKLNQWLEQLTAPEEPKAELSQNHALNRALYILDHDHSIKAYCVNICLTRPRKNGNGYIKGSNISADNLAHNYFRDGKTHITDTDKEIGQLLSGSNHNYWYETASIQGKAGALALELMIDTGRCFWRTSDSLSLHAGPKHEIELSWEQQRNGFCLSIQPKRLQLIPTVPVMYLDLQEQQLGVIDKGTLSDAQLLALRSAPVVPKKDAEALSQALFKHIPQLPQPVPVSVRDIHETLSPHLTLTRLYQGGDYAHCVLLNFYYGQHPVPALPAQAYSFIAQKAEALKIYRDTEAENAAMSTLTDAGFLLADTHNSNNTSLCLIPFGNHSVIESAALWDHFLTHELPRLEAMGWQITRDDDFALTFLDGDWEAWTEADEDSNDWFQLRFDLTLNNQQTVPLAPLLGPLLEMDITDPQTLPETLTLPLGNDQYVRLPSQRIAPFLATIKELFEHSGTQSDENLRLSRFELDAIDRLGDKLRGAEQLQQLAQQLKSFDGIRTIAPPAEFLAQLRPYQQQGLNWLQFLRHYQLNGVLADDMGLGKTVQTLAHLIVEKQHKRLTKPVLILAPTSLMGNWRREAERFTPDLNVCVLHGSKRHHLLSKLGDYDLILTTYPLLPRDFEAISAQHFHSLILDEAQTIKNPNTQMAKCVRKLHADHRLCLSGTPMENHLGELWALFDFLMPGFLGTSRQFKNYYRTPIEKEGNHARNSHLQRRIAPFMLRRTKTEVASELPPKTEIQQMVVLDKQQAELYESIRVTMEKQVRAAIAKQGLGRSHITILDALLKLRQTCCDPRLLKIQQAKNIKHSAKLEVLLELMEELLSENRRILIFSQFTSMLNLIEETLIEKDITLTKLTGRTRKRDEAIELFRTGEANVFLISLKAGGTGLNLVEADTVIIYDPWWNPAVENQAIDRAHRIGQQNPVFVYRLITENTVEEKIIALQAQKSALAEGIYAENSEAQKNLLNAETLQQLFTPLEENDEG